MKKKIIVEDYNPVWKDEFESLKSVYLDHLKGLDIKIEHVGSTSVEGLAAKPIIDIDIIVNDKQNVDNLITRLTSIGYIHQGDLGIKGREAFKRESEYVPYNDEDKSWMNHHLYVCVKGNTSLNNHLKLRQYLRRNPQAVKEYGELKKSLAEQFPYDIDSYIEHKTPFITSILSKMGMTTQDVEDIQNQNKKN